MADGFVELRPQPGIIDVHRSYGFDRLPSRSSLAARTTAHYVPTSLATRQAQKQLMIRDAKADFG